jgi:hypothetical protein
MGVTVENLNREISKSKEYVDNKFSTISGEIQEIKQRSSAEISRLSATLADFQTKLVTGTSDSISPAVPVRVDIRSEAVQQVDGVTNTAGSNNALSSVHGANGVNGCSTSVCNDINSVTNQPNNSRSYGNVNATSELHAKSAELCEQLYLLSQTAQSKFLFTSLGTLTSISFSDSLNSISISDRQLTNYAYPWYSEQSKNLSQSSGCPVPLINFRVTMSLRKPLRNLESKSSRQYQEFDLLRQVQPKFWRILHGSLY